MYITFDKLYDKTNTRYGVKPYSPAHGRGRTAGHPAAPAQIPAGEIIAPGSCLR